ncbi:MAG: PDZ domain-containing protein [Acidaminococcaceae bacterium]|nr:PDZ domain-containing protein [Acidaminococcaceae bacterium]
MKKCYRYILLSILCLLTAGTAPSALAASPGDWVVPVGLAVGIQADCDGVMVSGLAGVETPAGSVSPAEEAGLRPGDRIVAIGGERVHSGEEFMEKVSGLSGESVELQAVRGGKTISALVTPRQGPEGRWQLGLWLRPGVRGIGTVTFWDPANGEFGALGHAITLPESGELFALSSGVITAAKVSSVEPGRSGTPGELCAVSDPDAVLGVLEENTLQGVFGTAKEPLCAGTAVPVAADSEICLGEATILSTVDESGPRAYSAQITRISRGEGETRQLSLEVTDPALLSCTGGIVQGMSGSPILQNGKLVGAVTHVLVSNPSQGYGISMENMLRPRREEKNAA